MKPTNTSDGPWDAVAAEFVVTVSGGTLSPGWVGFEGPRIREVSEGMAPRELKTFDGGPGSVLLPGLVSAHSHVALGGLRSVADDRPFLDWIHRGILPALQAVGDDRAFFLAGARQSARELLEGGVTCVGDNFYRLEGPEALRETGQKGVFFFEVFGSMSEDEAAYRESLEGQLQLLEGELPNGFGYSPHTPWTCPKRTFQWIADRARNEGRRLSFHLDESEEEHLLFTQSRGDLFDMLSARGTLERFELGKTPTALLSDLGALGPHAVAAHCVQITDDDIEILARTGTSVAHCPVSNMKLAEGVAPVAALLEAGVNVALGVDSAASSGMLDLFQEMRICLLVQRALTRRISPMVAGRVLRMATLGGAKALGLDDELGTLEVGKAADVVLLKMEDLRHRPVKDPVATLVYCGTPRDVDGVFIDGALRFRRLP